MGKIGDLESNFHAALFALPVCDNGPAMSFIFLRRTQPEYMSTTDQDD